MFNLKMNEHCNTNTVMLAVQIENHSPIHVIAKLYTNVINSKNRMPLSSVY